MQLRLDECERETAEKRDIVQRLIREVEAREGSVQVVRERIAAAARDRDRIEAERRAAAEGREGVRGRVIKMNAFIEDETAALSAEDERQQAREAELSEKERRLSALESKAEEEKQQIIQSMNRLGNVRSQRARLDAMKTALQNQLGGMEDRARPGAGRRGFAGRAGARRAVPAGRRARAHGRAEESVGRAFPPGCRPSARNPRR